MTSKKWTECLTDTDGVLREKGKGFFSTNESGRGGGGMLLGSTVFQTRRFRNDIYEVWVGPTLHEAVAPASCLKGSIHQ